MSKRKTNFEFVEEVKKLVGDEYIFEDEYIDNHTKLRVLHTKCNNIYKVSPRAFLSTGRRCPFCNGGVRKSDEQFIKDFYESANDEYLLLSNYVNAKTKIKVKHLVCGTEYYVKPSKFLSNERCPECYGSHKKTTQEFRDEIFKLVDNEYDIVDDYISADTKIRFIHNKCGNVFYLKPNTFLSGCRCPFCKQSKGESRIGTYCKNKGIRFEQQKVFDGCRKLKDLRFDFYLPDLNVCIEYDGEFHYQVIFNKNDLTKQKERDIIKDRFCDKNHITLIRIPYWDFNRIEDILNLVLSSKDVNINKKKEDADG